MPPAKHSAQVPARPARPRTPKVSARAKADVLARIQWHCGGKDHCWPGNPRLIQDTGHCERTVQYALRALEEEGVIRVEQPTSRRRLIYLLHPASQGAKGLAPSGRTAPHMHPNCFEQTEGKKGNNTLPKGMCMSIPDLLRSQGKPVPDYLEIGDGITPRMGEWHYPATAETPKSPLPDESPRMQSWAAPPPTSPSRDSTPVQASAVVAKLTTRGVAPGVISDLVRQYPAEQIVRNIVYFDQLMKSGKTLANHGAYLAKAIRGDYAASTPTSPLSSPKPTPEEHAAALAQEARQQALKRQRKAQEEVLAAKAKSTYECLSADALSALEAEALARHPHLAKLPPRDQGRLSFIRMGVFLIIKEKLIADSQPT